jgi:adenosylmethionine-8-amino-7-oxononanoate aminotransferase
MSRSSPCPDAGQLKELLASGLPDKDRTDLIEHLESCSGCQHSLEEIANTITHGIGLLLSIAGFVVLLVLAALRGTAWHIVACSIYGATLICLYTASTLYHAVISPRVKRALRIFDYDIFYYQVFEPVLEALHADDLEAVIEREGARTIAAFIAEPILGASAGAAVPPDEYTTRVRETCRRHGIVFIDDEVMTGFGRTGRWFGIEWSGAAPDLVTCGKGMAGGYMPVGAVLASEAIVETVERAGGFVNGFTFSHHPVTAAAALATLEILERERLVERAAVVGERALARLQALRARPQVGDVRGRGLMLAVELVADALTGRAHEVGARRQCVAR